MNIHRPSAHVVLGWALALLITASAMKGVWLLALTLYSEMHPAHHGWDGAIYTAVGRGILNGLLPYVDLFETKPPGMFLLSAVSLWFFDDIRLANVLQGLVEIGTFSCLLLSLLYLPKDLHARDRGLIVGTALVCGTLLLTYSVSRSGHFQSESFGTFFIVLYGCNVLLARHYWSMWRIAISALCLMFAIGIKEPFFLVGLATSLLLVPRWRDLVPLFLIPLGIALVTGSLVMLAIGYLEPYLSIYLPEMLNGRGAYFRVPVWYYIFLVNYPLADIARFSLPLAITLPILWCVNVVHNADAIGDSRKARHLIALVVAFTTFIVAMGFIVRSYAGESNVATGLFIAGIMGLCAFSGIAIYLLRRSLPHTDAHDIVRSTTRYGLSVILVLYVMGSGGFLTQHYGFPIALYAILFLLFFLYSIERWAVPFSRYVFIVVSLLSCIGVWLLPVSRILPALAERIEVNTARQSIARHIDAVMDACNYERYLIVDSANVPYEFTHHSPFGPGFHRIEFTVPVLWRKQPIPYLLDEFQANLQRATFAVAPKQRSKDMPQSLATFLQEHFTKTTPPCAADIDLPDDFNFLFKRG